MISAREGSKVCRLLRELCQWNLSIRCRQVHQIQINFIVWKSFETILLILDFECGCIEVRGCLRECMRGLVVASQRGI